MELRLACWWLPGVEHPKGIERGLSEILDAPIERDQLWLKPKGDII